MKIIYKIVVLLTILHTRCFSSSFFDYLTKKQQEQFQKLSEFRRNSQKICPYQLRYLEWCKDINERIAQRENKTLEEFIKEENDINNNFKKYDFK